MDIQCISLKITSYINRFHDARSVYQTYYQSGILTWQPHPPEFVKFNCDGAWTALHSLTGIGVICRDKDNILLASHSLALNNVGSSLDAEGVALEYSMKLANHLKLEKVIFETDCTNLAECIWFLDRAAHPSTVSWQSFCIGELYSHSEWKLHLIRREANISSDLAAKHAQESGLSWTRIDACPMYLGPCICSDA